MGKKLDLLVDELERYKIAVAGIQEIKQLGLNAWTAAKRYMLLHSGRPFLDVVTGRTSRGEGVSIVLNKKLLLLGGQLVHEEWRAVISRLVVARLKWTHKFWRRPK